MQIIQKAMQINEVVAQYHFLDMSRIKIEPEDRDTPDVRMMIKQEDQSEQTVTIQNIEDNIHQCILHQAPDVLIYQEINEPPEFHRPQFTDKANILIKGQSTIEETSRDIQNVQKSEECSQWPVVIKEEPVDVEDEHVRSQSLQTQSTDRLTEVLNVVIKEEKHIRCENEQPDFVHCPVIKEESLNIETPPSTFEYHVKNDLSRNNVADMPDDCSDDAAHVVDQRKEIPSDVRSTSVLGYLNRTGIYAINAKECLNYLAKYQTSKNRFGMFYSDRFKTESNELSPDGDTSSNSSQTTQIYEAEETDLSENQNVSQTIANAQKPMQINEAVAEHNFLDMKTIKKEPEDIQINQANNLVNSEPSRFAECLNGTSSTENCTFQKVHHSAGEDISKFSQTIQAGKSDVSERQNVSQNIANAQKPMHEAVAERHFPNMKRIKREPDVSEAIPSISPSLCMEKQQVCKRVMSEGLSEKSFPDKEPSDSPYVSSKKMTGPEHKPFLSTEKLKEILKFVDTSHDQNLTREQNLTLNIETPFQEYTPGRKLSLLESSVCDFNSSLGNEIMRGNQNNNFATSSQVDTNTLETTIPASHITKRIRAHSLEDVNPKKPKLSSAEHAERISEAFSQIPLHNSIRDKNYSNQYYDARLTPEMSNIPLYASACPKTRPKDPAPAPAVFEPRKGSEDCLSMCRFGNIGRHFITSEFSTYVLQWNPSWFCTQRRCIPKFPPICESYRSVKYAYKNEKEYYNTYICLLFVEIWLKMDAALDKSPSFRVVLTNQEVETFYTKIGCEHWLRDTDVWPKREDIVLCRVLDAWGGFTEFFGNVKNVMTRSCDPPAGQIGNWHKIRFDIYCVQPLSSSPADNKVDIQILYNIRIAELQNDALRSISDAIKHLVMNPGSNTDSVSVIRYLPDLRIKDIRDKILVFLLDVEKRVVLVDTTPEECDDVELMTLLAFKLAVENSLVLVCLKTEIAFFKLVRRLMPYNPVLAVRTKEMHTPLEGNLLECTLDWRLGKGESIAEIYERKPITVCLYSALSHRPCRREFSRKSTICLLGEAHLCTEVETALPLMYGAERLVLFGKPNEKAIVHSSLKQYKYDTSLLNRFYRFL